MVQALKFQIPFENCALETIYLITFTRCVCFLTFAKTRWPEFHAMELHLLQRSFLDACPNPTVPSMIRCSEGAPKRESRRYDGFCWAVMDQQWSVWVLISCLGERLPKTSVPPSKSCFVRVLCDKSKCFFH